MPCKTHQEYDEALGQRAETREHIDVPQYIQDNAKRGLEFYEEGFGGDGLVQTTINEARDMAEGNVSHEKAKKMKNWFSRHIQIWTLMMQMHFLQEKVIDLQGSNCLAFVGRFNQ